MDCLWQALWKGRRTEVLSVSVHNRNATPPPFAAAAALTTGSGMRKGDGGEIVQYPINVRN